MHQTAQPAIKHVRAPLRLSRSALSAIHFTLFRSQQQQLFHGAEILGHGVNSLQIWVRRRECGKNPRACQLICDVRLVKAFMPNMRKEKKRNTTIRR